MLTPLEIHEKEFRRVLRGYSEVEVDEFLDQVVRDFEQLLRENSELKAELEKSREEVARYQKIEETLQNTLVVAQRTSEELQAAARREADLIIKEARARAREVEEAAKQKILKMAEELERLIKAHHAFLSRMKASATSYLSQIEAEEREQYESPMALLELFKRAGAEADGTSGDRGREGQSETQEPVLMSKIAS